MQSQKSDRALRLISIRSFLVACAVLLVLLTAASLLWRSVGDFDEEMHAEFNRIEIGDTNQDVLVALGEPIQGPAEDCILPQSIGFEEEFQRAAESDAVEYFLWKNGINTYYCVGFDDGGRVAFMAQGVS